MLRFAQHDRLDSSGFLPVRGSFSKTKPQLYSNWGFNTWNKIGLPTKN
jgi:hypothetical protein